MFQKLTRERPGLREYMKDLLEKGEIVTSKGGIFLRRRQGGHRTLIVHDTENDILFHMVAGRLDITRGLSTFPNKYSFKVRKMGDLDPSDLDSAFHKYEGFETALRDLYHSVDVITDEYGKTVPTERRMRTWWRSSRNRIFLFGAILYAALTLAVLF